MQINFNKSSLVLLEKNYEEALNQPKFKQMVKSLKWTKEEIMTRVTKLQHTIEEMDHCEHCEGLFQCHNDLLGHLSVPKKEDGNIFFTYIPCHYQKEEIASKKSKTSEENINDTCRMKDIDIKDKKRKQVIEWLDKFYDTFAFSLNMKGLYLHGSFGSGKTFLISSLLHELQVKKNVHTKVIYFPEIIRDLKADWDSYDSKMNEYQRVDILCIDDIGAEKVSDWSRDEVLGTILQYRMNHNLTTFFTSNLDEKELEKHFVGSDKSDDTIKARRIMERIKQLSIDMELISENRRNS